MALSVSAIRSIGVFLMFSSLLVLYGVLFRWDEYAAGGRGGSSEFDRDVESRADIDMPDGHPPISNGGSCPLGYSDDGNRDL